MAISTPVDISGSVEQAGAPNTTIAGATTATVPSGGFIWLTVQWHNAVTVSSVSGGGLTWTIDHQGSNPSNAGAAIISAPAPSGLASGTTLTVTFSGTAIDKMFQVMYSTGVQTGSAYGAVGVSGTTAAWTAGPITIAATGDIIIACSHWAAGSGFPSDTPSASYNDVTTSGVSNGESAVSQYRITTGTGSHTAGGTWSATPTSTRSAAVAYAAAAGGATIDLPYVVMAPPLPT